MSIKESWKKNVDAYEIDTVFEHRFSMCPSEEKKKWVNELYKSKIPFYGTNLNIFIEDFSNIDFKGTQCEHQEWVAQLNRFRWLAYATAEYAETKSDFMAQIVYDSINSWMEFWPYYGDRTDIYPFRQHEFWDPMMSTPIRLGFNKGSGWVGCLPEFFDHPLFTDEFVEKVFNSMMWQLKPMLYNNMEKSGEHNWRPNELDCLMFVSQVFSKAKKYEKYAVENLNDTFEAQFEQDGSHIEHTYDYHNWISAVFVNLYFLSENRPNLGLEIGGVKLIKAMDYSIDSLAPDRRSFGIHDSWPWHPNNNQIDGKKEEMRKKIASSESMKNIDCSRGTGLDFIYPDAGQYFFNSNNVSDTKFYFDASRWGSWHCHLSRNSVNMYHGGRMLLIDPGSLDYGTSEIRSYGKFTTSHNTITINGLSQCIYANPEILESKFNEDVALLVSSYQGGYQDMYGDSRPVPAEHERIFLWVRDRFALVFDNINIKNNKQIKNIACHWQLPEGQVCHIPDEKSVNTLFDDSNVYVKCIYADPVVKTVIHEGEENPLLGYVTKTGGKLSGGIPAPMFSTEADTDAEFVRMCHIIIPYGGTGLPKVSVKTESTRYAMDFVIEIDGNRYEIASHYFKRNYFKTNSAIRKIGSFDSFSRVAVKGFEDGKEVINWTYR